MNIGIIGSGATGLTCAYELCKKGHNVTILEAMDGHGGLVTSLKLNGTSLEKFYHHIFTSDTHLIELSKELGIDDKLLWIEPKNGIFSNNKLYPFSTPIDLLTYPAIPLYSRIRMGLAVLRAKNVEDWMSLENVSAKDWIIQIAGKKVYEKVWGPLLYSKFDIDAEEISAVWLWNKFKLRGSTRNKSGSKELLGYMQGGFEIIYTKLIEKIKSLGAKVNFGEPLVELTKNEDSTLNVVTNKNTYTFDKVLITFAPKILKEIKTPFEKEYLDKFNNIKYKANICMILELKKQLTPYYWITITEKDLPFVVFVEHTNFMPKEDYGSHIVYLSRYIDESDPLYRTDSETIAKRFLEGLSKIAPDFTNDDLIKVHVNRARFTQPVIYKNYSKIRMPIQSPIDNIFIANMSNIYPEDRGQNYSIRLGKEVSRMIDGGN